MKKILTKNQDSSCEHRCRQRFGQLQHSEVAEGNQARTKECTELNKERRNTLHKTMTHMPYAIFLQHNPMHVFSEVLLNWTGFTSRYRRLGAQPWLFLMAVSPTKCYTSFNLCQEIRFHLNSHKLLKKRILAHLQKWHNAYTITCHHNP